LENADKWLSCEVEDAGSIGGVFCWRGDGSKRGGFGARQPQDGYFFHRLRQIIARQLEDSLPVEGHVEVDESYFGGVREGSLACCWFL
jgi:hypothetical protein